jgi:UDP-glucose 4-epimerase
MIQRALQHQPILVFGDGGQSRCFSAVSDVVRGVMKLADTRGTEGEIYNIGTDEEVTVLELARRVKTMCRSDSVIEFVAYEDIYGASFEDMRRRVPNLAKIRKACGYVPQVTLDQLLEVTVRDTCEQMDLPVPVGLVSA